MHLKTRALALFLLACPLPALAATEEPTPDLQLEARSKPTFTFYFENDTFADTDRHYTNGLKLSWVTRDLATWGQSGWRKNFVDALPFVNRPGAQKNLGFAFGQNIYTPQDTDLAIPDPNDRPYAGWSYLEWSFSSKTRTMMDTVSIQIGIVGPHSYAEDAQKIAHKWLNNSQPQGWDHQLHDELGVNLVFERASRLYAHLWNGFLGVDFAPHLGVSIGNVQTHLNAGGTARVGFNLPSDFGVNLIRAGGSSNSPIDDRDPRLAGSASLFVFGGADGRAVARDIFLDGNTFRDSPNVDRENFVGDVYYGAGVVMGNWQITYTEVLRTREFVNQRIKNYFGSVTISFTW